MARWKLKGCPRCKGDLLVERVEGRWDEYCLQCGYRRGLRVVSPNVPVSDRVRPAVLVEDGELVD